MKTKIVRYLGSVGLLLVIWKHTHWSVALCLTFITLADEVNVELANKRFEILDKRISRVITR